ncbi:hypothetical protein CR513_39117, partial [Mucuna pruriens]
MQFILSSDGYGFMVRLHMEKKGEKYSKNSNKGRKEVSFKEGDLVRVVHRHFSHQHALPNQAYLEVNS